MFIAHLPAGYLLTKFIQNRTGDKRCRVMITGLVASVIPDLDLIYFYLWDNQQSVHHSYLMHVPLFWLCLSAITVVCLRLSDKKYLLIYLGVALANIMLHMVLDSIAAEIMWLYPFSNWQLNLVKVPAQYHWWVWNFVLHWTFMLEITIIITALTVWIRA